MLSNYSSSSLKLPIQKQTCIRIQCILEQLVKCFKRPGRFHNAQSRNLVGQFLLTLAAEPFLDHLAKDFNPPTQLVDEHRSKINLVQEYTQRNYYRDIPIAKIVKLAGMSRSHFHAIFKRYSYCTFLEYLYQQRLLQAKNRLEESKSSIDEIALACGFKNMSHFHRSFKKRYHVTPLRYRKIFDKESKNGIT
ncbi:MAG: AraC family transcriptional regulator [Lentisphaeria bacterium]|nr:AraC family transcriptional regulator [Lentisphaeria bacterium]